MYKKENEYVMSLPRFFVAGKVKRFYPDSISWLFLKKINSLKVIGVYLIQVVVKWRWLAKTKNLRNKGLFGDGIVIGNGPSQGFLDVKGLLKFKASGGEIICINFWADNTYLSKVIPTYLVISDPSIFSDTAPNFIQEKNEKLLSYLQTNVSVIIICPLERCVKLSEIFGKERILGFVDQELRMWTSNINPIFPRGYLSMTLYKALALATWFNYRKIYIIGMDNTYPRNIYCDQNNKLINHEVHSGTDDYSLDVSALYGNIGDSLTEIANIFYDVRKFKNDKIINLDPYSLTDVFLKIDKSIGNISNLLNAKNKGP